MRERLVLLYAWWYRTKVVPAWNRSPQRLWVILSSWVMISGERTFLLRFWNVFILGFFGALWAPQADRHLVPSYWWEGRHLYELISPKFSNSRRNNLVGRINRSADKRRNIWDFVTLSLKSHRYRVQDVLWFVFFAQEKLCNLWPCDVFTKLEKLKKKKKVRYRQKRKTGVVTWSLIRWPLERQSWKHRGTNFELVSVYGNRSQMRPRCVSKTQREFEFTLATCAFRSLFSTSRLRFSPRAVVRDASLELSRASRSLSLCCAPAKSDSFLVFLYRHKENIRGEDTGESRGKHAFCFVT